MQQESIWSVVRLMGRGHRYWRSEVRGFVGGGGVLVRKERGRSGYVGNSRDVWLRLIVAISSRHAPQNNQCRDKGCRRFCGIDQCAHSCSQTSNNTNALTHKSPYILYARTDSGLSLQHLQCSVIANTQGVIVTGSSALAGHQFPGSVLSQANSGHTLTYAVTDGV